MNSGIYRFYWHKEISTVIYNFSKTFSDLNECTQAGVNAACGKGQFCINTVGSYECRKCPIGFTAKRFTIDANDAEWRKFSGQNATENLFNCIRKYLYVLVFNFFNFLQHFFLHFSSSHALFSPLVLTFGQPFKGTFVYSPIVWML